MKGVPLVGREPLPISMRPECRWCGRVLRPHWDVEWPITSQHAISKRLDGYGGYGDSLFCGHRCGHAYAVRAYKEAAKP